VFRAERLFMQLRGGFMTQEEMRKMVAAYFEDTLALAEDARADGSGVLGEDSEDGSNESLEGLDLHLSDLVEDLAKGRHEAAAAKVADSILDCAGLTLDKASHEYRVLCREALKGAIAATKVQLERMKGHYPERSEAPVATSPVSAPPPPAAPRVLLSEALAEYVKEHSGGGHWTEKTKAESQGIYALLLGIVGDRDTVELDYKSLAGFRDALTRFPSNVSKKKVFRGKSIPQILKMDIVDPLSVSSVNKHLIRVGAFLRWATRRGYVVANYAEGLTITQRNKKEEEEREAYSKEDLLRLAQSPLAGFRKTHPERYWIPLLGLYTGARLNELCQLYTEDIREEEGITCIDINEKEDKKTKTASSRRLVPVHPTLIDLGFKEYVDSLRAAGEPRLWPALKKKRDGYGSDLGKWYQRFNRKFVTTEKLRVFHSMRHTLANELKQRGVDGNIIAEILGHSLGSMSLGRYGKAFGPKVLLDALRKVDFGIEEELRVGD
jgi:integrase